MGQPINIDLIKTGGGSPFGKNIVLTFTCDENADKAVRAAAKAAGFPGDILNTYVVPSFIMNTNDALDATSDIFILAQRTAQVTGPDNADAPIVFRVTPPTPTPAAQLKPFPAPELRVRGTGKTEMDWTPAVETLREGILAQYPGQIPQEYTTAQWVMQSPMAIQEMVNSVGDTSDAAYLGTQENFKLSDDPSDFLIYYGVDHTKAEKAAYTTATLYTSCKLCGVAAVFNDDLNSTALDYLQGSYPFDPTKLFAYKIARNCNGALHCKDFTTSDECGKGASLDDDLFLSMRIYLEPKTKTGPSYTELVYDKVMHFTAAPLKGRASTPRTPAPSRAPSR